jgi:hypothetical protein
MRNLAFIVPTLLLLLIVNEGQTAEYHADVTDQGVPFILIDGSFEMNDSSAELVELSQLTNAEFVVFNSVGGNVGTALEIGRAIRQMGMNTVQLRSLECASACAFAFMGGVNRFAEPGAIGVHRSSFGTALDGIDAEVAVSAVQLHTAEVIEYLLEMDVDPAILQLALSYDANDIRYLSASEMVEFRLLSDQRGPIEQAPVADVEVSVAIETGKVHHPSGHAPVKLTGEISANNAAILANGTTVRILQIRDNWYRVQSDQADGWMERSWIAVDGFEGGHTDQRYIQIASYSTSSAAIEFVEDSGDRLWVFETSTGWFAVTLPTTYEQAEAAAELARMKEEGAVPSDSFFHYGNTYIQRLCCE